MVESRKDALVRYTCFNCREPIGHRDFVSIKEKSDGHLLEGYNCVPCAIESLRELVFEEAVKTQVVLKWIGKTWSFEMPLYEKEVWDDFQRSLKEGTLFPEDSLVKR